MGSHASSWPDSDGSPGRRRSGTHTRWIIDSSPQVDTTDGQAGLVAVKTGPNLWRGMWTYDPVHVSRVNEYLTRFF
jgi:hypothetical protein